MGAVFKGIDISTWQGAPDFAKVKADGIQFVIARAGYGSNNIDKQFKRNAAECNRLGIPFGVYWFSYALTAAGAAQEARYCLEAVKPYRLEYPVFFDLEYDTVRYAKKKGVTIAKALATQMAAAFCGEIEKAGYYAANYANADYLAHMLDQKALSRFDLWYAWYNSTCNRSDAGVWQYGSKGRVSGISSGSVDMDYSMKDYPGIIRGAGLNGLTKAAAPTKPAAPKKTVSEIADEVLAGKWGNGAERKKRISTAGYDYAAVQAAVNAKLKGTAQKAREAKIKAGDKVKVKKAVQYSGKPFKPYYSAYDVISVSGDRAVIGIGKTVTAAVNVGNLTKL